MKVWAYLAIILAIAGFAKWAHYTIDIGGFNRCSAESLTNVNTAVAAARKDEQLKQEKVNAAAQTQFDELNDINSKLNDDLDGLRKRATRRQSKGESKTICEGATGESLSSEDAGFLTREAARADALRIGLKACYTYADTISQ